MTPRRVVIAGALVLVAGTALLYANRLACAPIYLTHDEVNFSLQAISIARTGHDLNGRFLPLYFSEPEFAAGRDPLMIYATALALQVLPISEWAVRLPTALVGVLNVGLMLVLTWRIFGSRWLALAASILLALSPAHFIHSRMALSVMYPLPCVLLWLIFLHDFDRSGDRRTLAAGAVALGLGVYAYLAGLLLMPLYVVLTAVLLVERRSPRHLWWVAAVFGLMLVPLGLWQLAHPERYEALIHAYRVGEAGGQGAAPGAGLFSVPAIRERIGTWWLFFDPSYLFLTGDSSLNNSTRQAGAFPLAFVVLLPVGLYRLWRGSTYEHIVLIGFVTAPIAVVLTGTLDLNRYRGVVVLPFGVLVAAFGVHTLWTSRQRVFRWVAAGLLVSVPWQFAGFYTDYMGDYREAASVWFGRNLRGAIVDVLDRAPAGPVFVSRAIPYADRYWSFYTQAGGRREAPEPTFVDGATFDAAGASAGALLIAAVDEPWIAALDVAGWTRVAEAAEPSGAASFVILRKNQAASPSPDSVVSWW